MVVTVTCRGGTAVSSHGFRASGPASVQPDPTICLPDEVRSAGQRGPWTQRRCGRVPRASHTARPRASGSVGWTGARRWLCRPGGCPHPSRKAKPGHPAPSQRRLPPGPPALLSTGPPGGGILDKEPGGADATSRCHLAPRAPCGRTPQSTRRSAVRLGGSHPAGVCGRTRGAAPPCPAPPAHPPSSPPDPSGPPHAGI